jgi:hypothetical protein
MRSAMFRSLKTCLLLIPALFVLAAAENEPKGKESEPKMALKQTANAKRLEAAIKRHTETLGEYLSEEKKFSDNLTHDQIVSRASSIALLAHGLISLKSTPDSIDPVKARTAAQKIAEAENYADAAKNLKLLQEGLEGPADSSGKAAEELGWDEVADFTAMMEDVTELIGKLRRTHRRSRDPEADSLDAMTAAVLAYATKAELSYAFDEADEAKWEKYSKQMHDDFFALDAAMRAKDTDKTREIYDRINDSCNACHKDFRD